MKKTILTILSAIIVLCAQAQTEGIRFFSGTFTEALKEAETTNKLLFVDVYAEWCGPCKMLSEQVFPNAQVGNYFNEKFICVKLNSDDLQNRSIVEKFQIKALPTLLILNAKEEVIQTHCGMLNPDQLLRLGRIALGEQKSPDEMFDAYKKENKNITKLQDILLDAPYFMPTLEGMQRDKWMKRIQDLSKVYFETRKPEEMINRRDFNILTLFHDKMDKEDTVINYVIAHYSDFFQAVDTLSVANYLMAMHSNAVIELARKGDKDYSLFLQRMVGDLLPIYKLQFPDPQAYCAMYGKIADANYAIYSERSFPNYIGKMDEFLQLHGNPQAQDYAMIVETLFNATKGQLSKDAFTKTIEWLEKALAGKVELEMQVGMVMTIGDCYVGLENTEKAKECYNEAYMLVLKSQNQNFVAQIQQMIKQKLELL